MEIKVIRVKKPEGLNVIIGQAHFIKTVEDIYEVLVESAPLIKFGLAFSEASGKCLVRSEGNNQNLKNIASENVLGIGCGHLFFIALEEAYPVSVLNRIKNVSEVCSIICATANPLELIIVETKQGRGCLGAIDGFSPKGVEQEEDIVWRKKLLRSIKYKL